MFNFWNVENVNVCKFWGWVGNYRVVEGGKKGDEVLLLDVFDINLDENDYKMLVLRF